MTALTTKTKRNIGLVMLILMGVVFYVALFVSACGMLVERGWGCEDASKVVALLFVGFPAAVGYTVLALRLVLDNGDD